MSPSEPCGPSADPHDATIRTLTQVVRAFGRLLPPNAEMVLHDLRLLPDSIVAIEGTLTGRGVGEPATDLLLRKVNDTSSDTFLYEAVLPTGRRVSSMTTIFRAPEPIAALCLNFDTSGFAEVTRFLAVFMPSSFDDVGAGDEGADAEDRSSPETFVHDVDELSRLILDRAIAGVGVELSLMHKRHKKKVVRSLAENGFFALRESEERAAAALGVTRFTIYRYLTELRQEGAIAQ